VESRTTLDAAGRTDVGLVRPRNEDQFLVARLGRWMTIEAASIPHATREHWTPQGTLLVVADGMGGQGAGEVASAVVLDTFAAHSLAEMPWLTFGTPEGDALLARDLTDIAARCQDRLHEVAERKDLPRRLGTTFTAVYVHDMRGVVAHVGDTRAYLVRDGSVQRLTRDHNLAADLEALGQPAAHQNVLTNAIGGGNDKPVVDLTSMQLASGDRILLSSDGLHGVVDELTIARLVWGAKDPREACDALVQAAIERGAPDNVTAVVASIR
jgi:protein phosphatase